MTAPPAGHAAPGSDTGDRRLWRVFPYDALAPAGAPFSAAWVPRGQGAGRFDVPDASPVWYLAESPVHAVAEVLQGLRGQTLDADDLRRFGHPLACVDAHVPAAFAARVVDLCDPSELARRDIRPDRLASRELATTQRIARALHAEGAAGFRWWSSLSGDWHGTVLFVERLPVGVPAFGTPEPLAIASPVVRAACLELGIAVRRPRR